MTSIESTRLDHMEQKIDDLQKDVNKILTALTGDDLKMDEGLIAEYKELKGRVQKLEALKAKIIWVSIGAGVAAGISIDKVVEWITLAAK